MKLLALETALRRGAVAALLDGRLVGEKQLGPQERTTQALVPAMVSCLQAAGWQPNEVDVVAVTVGPGSFTGLRVGVTAAKTFAFAAGCDILGVNTLEAIAAQAPPLLGTVETVLDAQRSQLFVQRYHVSADQLPQAVAPARILDADQWLAGLEQEANVAVTGSGLTRVAERLPASVTVVAQNQWDATATAVAQVARMHYEKGRRDDLWTLVPLYYRLSAAEEKRVAAERANTSSGSQ